MRINNQPWFHDDDGDDVWTCLWNQMPHKKCKIINKIWINVWRKVNSQIEQQTIQIVNEYDEYDQNYKSLE